VTLSDDARLSAPDLVDALWSQDPSIAISKAGDTTVALNPQTLEDGEDVIVAEAIRDLLGN
jgi:hypothetical protein